MIDHRTMIHNEHQHRFITAPIGAPGKPIRQVCSAGAGTGKTTVLARRINYLINNLGVPANEIVAITFTRAAAVALQARIDQRIQYAGTLHALAMATQRIGKLMTEDETTDAIRTVLARTGIKMGIGDARALLQSGTDDHLGDAKVFLRSFASEVVNTGRAPFDLALRRFAFESTGATDRRSMNPEVLIVDEYQDTSALDQACFERIAPTRAMIVVGDERQAIYGFRGANPAIFRRATRKAGPDGVFPLTMTFRCARKIVQVANALRAGDGNAPDLDCFDDEDQGDASVREIETQREEEKTLIETARRIGPTETLAILTRYNADVERLRLALRSEGIQIKPRTSAERTAQSSVDTDVAEYLRAAIEPTAFLARFLSNLNRRQAAEIHSRWGDNDGITTAIIRAQGLAAKLAILWAPEGIRNHWAVAESQDDAARALNAIEGAIDGETEAAAGGIYVDTVHGVKGLEFDTVILANADTRWDTDVHDQARNLIYVAVTRAKKRFFATMARSVVDPWTGEIQHRDPSQILWGAIERAWT